MREHWLNPQRLAHYPRIFLACYILAEIALLAISHHGVDPSGHPLGRDFIGFWSASRLVLAGTPALVYDIPSIVRVQTATVPGITAFNPWIYPPTFLLLVAPLSLLPYLLCYLLFMVATFAAYAAVVRRIATVPGGLMLLLAFPGVYVNVLEGQNAFLTAALTGAALLLLRKRPLWAGLLIGLLTIKPHLGVLWPIALICGRHWRALSSAAAASVLFLAASVGILGADTLDGFFSALKTFSTMSFQDGTVFVKLPSLLSFAFMLGLRPGAALVVQAAVAAPTAAAVAWIWWRCPDFPLRAASLSLGSLLVSPYVLNYDLAWLALPIAWFAGYCMNNGWLRGEREVLVAAWLLPLLVVALATALHQQLGAFVLLAFFCAVCRRAWIASTGGGAEAQLQAQSQRLRELKGAP